MPQYKKLRVRRAMAVNSNLKCRAKAVLRWNRNIKCTPAFEVKDKENTSQEDSKSIKHAGLVVYEITQRKRNGYEDKK